MDDKKWWMQAFMKVIGYSGILITAVITSVLQVGYLPTLDKLSKATIRCDAPLVKPAPESISLLLPSERSEQNA
jgi:hypothetical protein